MKSRNQILLENKIRKMVREITEAEIPNTVKEKKQRFILYTNPNNVTSAAYVAWGIDATRRVLNSRRQNPGSYEILFQGRGTMEDVRKIIQYFSYYKFNF